MSTIFSLFMILIIIACVLLIIVIMAQNPKGGGLSGTFGGTSAASFGVQRTNEFMDKATWGLGAFIIVLIMLSVILTGKPSVAIPSKAAPAKQEQAPAQQTPAQQPAAAPVQPTK